MKSEGMPETKAQNLCHKATDIFVKHVGQEQKHAKSYIFPWCISVALSAFLSNFLRLD